MPRNRFDGAYPAAATSSAPTVPPGSDFNGFLRNLILTLILGLYLCFFLSYWRSLGSTAFTPKRSLDDTMELIHLELKKGNIEAKKSWKKYWQRSDARRREQNLLRARERKQWRKTHKLLQELVDLCTATYLENNARQALAMFNEIHGGVAHLVHPIPTGVHAVLHPHGSPPGVSGVSGDIPSVEPVPNSQNAVPSGPHVPSATSPTDLPENQASSLQQQEMRGRNRSQRA